MNCEQCKARMSEAVTERLSARQQATFEAHTQECANCREAFGRVQALLEAIDHGVEAQVAVDPSAGMMARIRRRTAEEAAPAGTIWAWWLPATACAAMLIIAAAVWLGWPRGANPRSVATTETAKSLPAIANHAAPNRPSKVAAARSWKEISSVASAHRAVLKRRKIEHEPEVIVSPGEAEAVLQFAAVLQGGKLDGAKLLADQKKAERPIEIKPIVIPPLEISTQADDAGAGPGTAASREIS